VGSIFSTGGSGEATSGSPLDEDVAAWVTQPLALSSNDPHYFSSQCTPVAGIERSICAGHFGREAVSIRACLVDQAPAEVGVGLTAGAAGQSSKRLDPGVSPTPSELVTASGTNVPVSCLRNSGEGVLSTETSRIVHFENIASVESSSERSGLGSTVRRRRTRRGERACRCECLTFLALNGSGKPQWLELLEDTTARNSERAIGPGDNLVCIFGQEHQQKGVAYGLFTEQCSRRGFKSASSEATLGAGGGASAGTIISVQKGKSPMGSLPFLGGADASPSEAPGRVTASWLQCSAFPGRGLLVQTAYLFVDLPLLHPSNVAILNVLAENTLAHGGLFVIECDWNASQAELEACGFLSRIGGVCVVPVEATTKYGTKIDFFVLSAALVAFVVSIEALLAVAARPHYRLRLRLHGRIENPIVPQVLAAAPFPRRAPMLPCRNFEPDVDGHLMAVEMASASLEEAGLSAAYGQIATLAEKELCIRYDRLLESSGKTFIIMIINTLGARHSEYVSKLLLQNPTMCMANLGF